VQNFDATPGKGGKPRAFPFLQRQSFCCHPCPKLRGGLSPSAVGVVERIRLIAAAFALIIAPFG